LVKQLEVSGCAESLRCVVMYRTLDFLLSKVVALLTQCTRLIWSK